MLGRCEPGWRIDESVVRSSRFFESRKQLRAPPEDHLVPMAQRSLTHERLAVQLGASSNPRR